MATMMRGALQKHILLTPIARLRASRKRMAVAAWQEICVASRGALLRDFLTWIIPRANQPLFTISDFPFILGVMLNDTR